jgi:hypothetical protein
MEQQIPPEELARHITDIPVTTDCPSSTEPPLTPTVIPRLPTRVEQPGRRAPLPDAVAIRRCIVPATAPPFDDERNGAESPDAASPAADDLVAADPSSLDQPCGQAAPCPGAAGQGYPDPTVRWPSQFAQVLAETLAGSRPARQLTPWTTAAARRRIRQLGPMLATDQRPKVRRVMTSAPAADVLEMTAVVGFGPRVRVLALRLERSQPRAYRQGGSRWCCTAIESA